MADEVSNCSDIQLNRKEQRKQRHHSELNRSNWGVSSGKSLFHSVLLLLFLAFPSTIVAHRLDEYLQATIVVIEPKLVRLQINLTPGVAVAGQVLALIDRDRDGVISTIEAAAYSESLKRDFIIRLDQRALKLKSTSSCFPGPAELRTGWGFIQMEFSATPGRLAAGAHRLTVENRHLPAISVYLVNAAQPRAGSVQITKQVRNEHQSVGEIEFTFQPPPSPFRAFGIIALLLALLVAVSAGAQRR
jgi:hypothetical protein